MRDAWIRKTAADWRMAPNLADRRAPCASVCWDAVRKELVADAPDFNIARMAVDRHAHGEHAQRVALRLLSPDAPAQDVSYAELQGLTDRFANGLSALGIVKGDRVLVLTGRILPLYVAVLGSLKNGCVVTPLFAAVGQEPIATCVDIAQAQVLVTTASLYRRKIEPIRPMLKTLRHVIVVDDDALGTISGTLDYASWLAQAPATPPAARTGEDDMALLHFTSGSAGTPKGAIHGHGAALTHFVTGRYALDLHDDDVFWCTADPGSVTGTSYGILAPLLLGVTSIVDSGDFDAERWYRILHDEQVTVWTTAPTAIRMLMKAGPELAHHHSLGVLRFVASIGEPLKARAVRWGKEVFGLPIHDNWWQTETGGIMIANTPAMDLKPGSMGKPLPGVEALIVQRNADGSVVPVEQPDVAGELALRAGSPAMFRGYVGQEERYRRCFAGDLYLTGDLARRDADGYFWLAPKDLALRATLPRKRSGKITRQLLPVREPRLPEGGLSPLDGGA